MRRDSRELAAIFAGGFIGAIARAELSVAWATHPGDWPWATFVVNIAGAFMLGYFATRLQERLPLSSYRRPFLGTGICGALTTRRSGTVNEDCLKLTSSFGERDRANGGFLADAFTEIYARHQLQTSLVIRGVAGFGEKQHFRTDRQLTLSEDLPVVSVAVDARPRIEAALRDVEDLSFDVVISVGDGDRIAQVLPQLGQMLARPLITLERVRLCKLDGPRLSEPRQLPQTDTSGLGVWQKLMVYAGEQAQHDGQPLYFALLQRLREAGAAGATSLRGIWGYHGDHKPHGDTVWQLRRRVPVVTVAVDTPDRIQQWFEIVDEVTAETGLVTSDVVPAYRATGAELERGGFKLAERNPTKEP